MSQAGILSSTGGGSSTVMQVDTDNGTAIPAGGILNIVAEPTPNQHAGSSVSFSGSGNTVLLNVTDAGLNTIIGLDSGNATMVGQFNTMFGVSCGTLLTNGSRNVAIGINALISLTGGENNIVIGSSTGDFYTGNESSNILIGSNVDGINGESNVLRIGSGTGTGQGELTQAFICGIDGVDVGSVATIVTENADQLGTAVLTAGTGITITPGPNTITIDATGGSGVTQIDGDTGSALPAGGIINVIANNAAKNAGSTVSFSAATDTVVLNVTDAGFNTVIGKNAGNLAMTANDNTVIGGASGTSLTTGSSNTVVGEGSLTLVTTGNRNVILGNSAAGNYTSSESDNILIGSNVDGLNGESHTLRIGAGTGTGTGALTQTFIGGIDGVNVGPVATVVTESLDQLGTAVITAGTGINVTAGANTITIAAAGVVTLSYTSVNSSPYVVLSSDDFISVDSSGGAITVQLPNAATLGRTYVIKDQTGSAATNNITVTTVGGAVNIDGAATFVMNTAYQAVSIIGNGFTYELY